MRRWRDCYRGGRHCRVTGRPSAVNKRYLSSSAEWLRWRRHHVAERWKMQERAKPVEPAVGYGVGAAIGNGHRPSHRTTAGPATGQTVGLSEAGLAGRVSWVSRGWLGRWDTGARRLARFPWLGRPAQGQWRPAVVGRRDRRGRARVPGLARAGDSHSAASSCGATAGWEGRFELGAERSSLVVGSPCRRSGSAWWNGWRLNRNTRLGARAIAVGRKQPSQKGVCQVACCVHHKGASTNFFNNLLRRETRITATAPTPATTNATALCVSFVHFCFTVLGRRCRFYAAIVDSVRA